MRTKRIGITDHAVDRALERLPLTSRRVARALLGQAWREGAPLPRRLGRRLDHNHRQARLSKKEQSRYRLWGRLLLVGRPGVVITMWTLDETELATVLVWGLLGRWVG